MQPVFCEVMKKERFICTTHIFTYLNREFVEVPYNTTLTPFHTMDTRYGIIMRLPIDSYFMGVKMFELDHERSSHECRRTYGK